MKRFLALRCFDKTLSSFTTLKKSFLHAGICILLSRCSQQRFRFHRCFQKALATGARPDFFIASELQKKRKNIEWLYPSTSLVPLLFIVLPSASALTSASSISDVVLLLRTRYQDCVSRYEVGAL